MLMLLFFLGKAEGTTPQNKLYLLIGNITSNIENVFRHLFAKEAKLLEFQATAKAEIQIQRLQSILKIKQPCFLKITWTV